MRTTVDIPEALLRRAKAEAALRGIKLKDFLTEALQAALRGERVTHETAPRYGEEPELRVGKDCVFPLIRGEGGPALRDATGESLSRLLEEEDIDRSRSDARAR